MANKKKTTNHSTHTSKIHKSGTYSERGKTQEIARIHIQDGTDRPLRLPGWVKDWSRLAAANHTNAKGN